jgi:divalent metal cation (Fe/Co/Zn/Cd) transporter
MASKLGKDAKAAFEIANLLDDAADAIRKRSKRAYREDKMSLEEYMETRARELDLRALVSVLVASDLSAALEEASEAGENIEQAIRDAKARIETLTSIKTGATIIGHLVSLASALASGDVQLVLKACRAVTEQS